MDGDETQPCKTRLVSSLAANTLEYQTRLPARRTSLPFPTLFTAPVPVHRLRYALLLRERARVATLRNPHSRCGAAERRRYPAVLG